MTQRDHGGPRRRLHRCARFAILLGSIHAGGAAGGQPALDDPRLLDPDNYQYLDQNWTPDDRAWFYHIDQGSRLLPYALFLALEQPASERRFSDPAFLLGFGLIPSPPGAMNPDGLPIGLARNDAFGEPHLGVTCAACHTQPMTYGDAVLVIDGGQALFDMQLLHIELVAALEATLTDTAKLARTTERLGLPEAEARRLVEQTLAARRQFARRNRSDIAYGFTRLDAFGAIMNKALLYTGVEDNYNPADAPISYPYLWDTPQHDYVEWNGLSQNSLVGALARNIGEVIGVFGEVRPERRQWLFYDAGYDSSIEAGNLRRIEKRVAKLESPLWPDAFPAIDAELAAAGRPLYVRYCQSCHQDIDRSDPDRRIEVRMSTVAEAGTDPKMADNALNHRGRSGRFAGQKRFYAAGNPLAEEVPALYVVNHLMGAVVKNHPLQAYLAKRDAAALGHPEVPNPPKYVDGELLDGGAQTTEAALHAYKARPLNGVWSSAPFLHNGSVPNLHELLLPAAERSEVFHLGSFEYDPVKVGYVDAPGPGAFRFDTRLPGNANSGHEYGTGYDGLPPLDAADRRALLEYLKTL